MNAIQHKQKTTDRDEISITVSNDMPGTAGTMTASSGKGAIMPVPERIAKSFGARLALNATMRRISPLRQVPLLLFPTNASVAVLMAEALDDDTAA